MLAVMLPVAGFFVGVLATSDGALVPLAVQERTAPAPVTESSSPESPAIPGHDVSGEDLYDLPRYPGSIRIEYIEEKQGEMMWTELEYLTDSSLERTREYYRDAFRASGWEVNDIGFAQSSWIFFVVKEEREVFVEIRPRGGVVEVDIEQTEPIAKDAPPVSSPAVAPAGDDDDDYYELED